MKSNLRKNILRLTLGLLLICVTAAFLEVQLNILRRSYDNFVLGNRNHYLSCRDLPTKSEVERVVEQHKEILQQIQAVAPEFVNVEIDSSTCEGKADLLISFGTQQQRTSIERMIGNETFFGVPYRLQNR